MEANEARQMEMLLEEGGIADDGTTVDPVSGNEVPPGSMAEEVRDDVPAQLSEGEYIVPADVTRYYGVKFFEDLRTEAKRGMGQMEADGRIGGEPVSQTMDNQTGGALTPEELAMLQEMGMAVGGMVPPPQAVGNANQYNEGGQVLYAQEGVDVTAANASTSGVNPYQAQFTQGMGSAFAPGYLSQQVIESAQAPQTSVVMLYSPDGIAVAVSLPAEQAKYDQLIAEGYTTQPVATTTETTVTTGNDDPPPTDTAKPVDYTGMGETELQKAYAQNKTAMAMMAGLAAINPVFGAFGVWATNSTKKKIEDEMKRQKFTIPEGGSIFDISLGGVIDSVKGLLGLSDEETQQVVAQVDSGDKKTVTPKTTASETAAIQAGGGATGDDDGPTVVAGGGTGGGDKYVFDEDTTDYTATDDDVFDAIDADFAAAADKPASATSIGSGVASTLEETGNTSGPFNAGGFVSKRSKKKKK